MKRKVGMGVLAFAAMAMTGMGLNVFAGVRGNPYQSIVARNPFGLRPVPPPALQPVKTPPAAPLPEIKLTGVTTLLSRPNALFQYEDKETKKVEFPLPLSEGETYKKLTVLHIDVANGRVRIRNGDSEATLDFTHNGVKVGTGRPPAARGPIAGIIPPQRRPDNPTASNPNSRVIVLGPPGSMPPANPGGPERLNAIQPVISREQAEAVMETMRRKLQAQQNPRVQPASLGTASSPARRLRQ